MAGPYWHFLTANQFIENNRLALEQQQKQTVILDYRAAFLSGVQGPDLNFYPGGDGQISSLAHGDRPADLGRALLEQAETGEQQAFAYGWLMHLTTDIITHPLVNRLITDHFPKQTVQGTDPYAYPLGHHRVEWGIDVNLLQDSSVKPFMADISEVLSTVDHLHPYINEVFKKTFDFEVSEEIWTGSLEGMSKYNRIFQLAWQLSGRTQDQNLLKQGLKSAGFHLLLKPIMKIAAIRNPENGAGVFIPIQPKTEEIEEVKQHASEAGALYLEYLTDDFKRLENRTG